MNIYIRCETKEKAYSFAYRMRQWNMLWCNLELITPNTTHWNYYTEDTIYFIDERNAILYGTDYAVQSRDKELSWEDFLSCETEEDFISTIQRLRV